MLKTIGEVCGQLFSCERICTHDFSPWAIGPGLGRSDELITGLALLSWPKKNDTCQKPALSPLNAGLGAPAPFVYSLWVVSTPVVPTPLAGLLGEEETQLSGRWARLGPTGRGAPGK